MLLEDKVALITGAATGIGRAGARRFAREGAKVIIADINDSEGEKTVAGIRQQGGEAAYIHTDLARVGEIERMVKAAAGTYGRLDIFWHNASVIFSGHIEALEEDHYDKEMTIGLKAGVFGAKFVIPVLREAGGGCILYTSSMVGLRPTPYMPGYSLTHGIEKAGIIMLMRCLVEPLARYNIRVNCVCPGPVETEKWERDQILQAKSSGVDPEIYLKAGRERLPIKRTITEEEIASAATFLVSDQASGITGVALPVDGGFTAL
ncbi:MAG: SDR family oxidoreductase [Chloroflexota bacterium]|nr:SDR family oxidoreductase [Chloroflexota bacterium]